MLGDLLSTIGKDSRIVHGLGRRASVLMRLKVITVNENYIFQSFARNVRNKVVHGDYDLINKDYALRKYNEIAKIIIRMSKQYNIEIE